MKVTGSVIDYTVHMCTIQAKYFSYKESKRYASCSSSSPAGFCFPAFPSRAWRLGKLAAFVSLPRGHLVRSGACLAQHRPRRATLVPTARQQGVAGEAASSGAVRWHWARLRKRVCALALAPWPVCQQGTRRLLAAIPHGQGSQKLLRPQQRCADPLPPHRRACLPSHLHVGRSLRPRETPPPLAGLVAGVVCRGASSRSDCGLRSWQAEPRRERASQGSRGGGGPCPRSLIARLTRAGYT